MTRQKRLDALEKRMGDKRKIIVIMPDHMTPEEIQAARELAKNDPDNHIFIQLTYEDNP
jgi:hypothetical protein